MKIIPKIAFPAVFFIQSLLTTGCQQKSPVVVKEEIIQAILNDARLGPLPKNATEVEVQGWTGFYTGTRYLKFKAPQEEIEIFISTSPSIYNRRPESFDKDKQLLAYPPEYKTDRKWDPGPHHYFHEDPNVSWYRPEIKVKGRRYQIPELKRHNWGDVIVDDEKGMVFIRVVWG